MFKYLLIVSLISCSLLKARPAADSGFLPNPERLKEMRERAPFNRLWLSPNLNQFKKIDRKLYIPPVNTDFLEKKFQKRFQGKKLAERLEEAQELASYMQLSFKNSIKTHPNKFMEIVEQPGENTFQLELAIVGLKPTKPAVNTLGNIVGFFFPGAGLISLFGSGSISIEAILRDYKTGEIVAEFADRESDKTAPFTIRDYQKYAHARNAITDWAEQYAELASTEVNHRVKDSSPFTLDLL